MAAARRPVANLLGLAVLGTLAQRPMHRYEIATTIREQGKDDDMDVKWGSLYTVVKNLERHGFVEAVGVDRDGARPERTTYRITDDGRREMAAWTRELVADTRPEHPAFAAGLSMLSTVPPADAIALLRARLDRLDAAVAQQREQLAGWQQQVPRLFLVEDEYGLALREAEADWIRGLLRELVSGVFPGVDAWQQAHDTGLVPPEGGPPAST